jgi:hypothetical protein
LTSRSVARGGSATEFDTCHFTALDLRIASSLAILDECVMSAGSSRPDIALSSHRFGSRFAGLGLPTAFAKDVLV